MKSLTSRRASRVIEESNMDEKSIANLPSSASQLKEKQGKNKEVKLCYSVNLSTCSLFHLPKRVALNICVPFFMKLHCCLITDLFYYRIGVIYATGHSTRPIEYSFRGVSASDSI